MKTLRNPRKAKKGIPESGLGLLLREAFLSYNKNFCAALSEYGLTYSQWRHLWPLLRDGQLTPVELSHRAGVTKASSTGIIQSLVEQQLIRREHDRADRRKVNLSLTPKGIKLIETLSLSGRIINMHAREGIPDGDYATMLETVRKIIANLDRLHADGDQDVLLRTICPRVPKR